MPPRPDPEELLRKVRAEEREARRGRLKIFLGYSSGVGKSYRMLDEGRRRMERGQDVVVGATQSRTGGDAEMVLRRLETIPMRTVDGTEVLDLEALLHRHPEVVLVDGLAFDNPPGSPYPHRWQEIEVLLESGISVIATVNLQFIEERRAAVERITGRVAKQSIPEEFLRTADEIEVVDAPPDLLCADDRRRPASELEQRRLQLSELRELALLLAADVIDHQLESYLLSHGIEPVWGTQERILVCITPWNPADTMIESGQRNAERFRGELICAYVREPGLAAAEQRQLEENVEKARAAGAQIAILEGQDFVSTILRFARNRGITQIFVGHSRHEHWWQRLAGSQLDRLIAHADGMDVRVFPN